MVARDEQRDRATERLAAHLLATGLSRISLRQLAAAAGASDRMLLYYFSDKADALGSATERVAGDLATRLADAIPAEAALSPRALLERAAALITGEDMRPYMRLWIDIVAAAARGEAPFVAIAGQIAAGFLHWIDQRLLVPQEADRAAISAMILASIDGLALVDICLGPEAAGRAAAALPALYA